MIVHLYGQVNQKSVCGTCARNFMIAVDTKNINEIEIQEEHDILLFKTHTRTPTNIHKHTHTHILRLRWAGHIARISTGTSGKIPLGRPRRRW